MAWAHEMDLKGEAWKVLVSHQDRTVGSELRLPDKLIPKSPVLRDIISQGGMDVSGGVRA